MRGQEARVERREARGERQGGSACGLKIIKNGLKNYNGSRGERQEAMNGYWLLVIEGSRVEGREARGYE